MSGLFSDLRLAVRSLLRTPGFTAVAVLAMAVGIGGTSAIFAGFDMLLLRPLALPASQQLVTLYERTADGEWNLLSAPNYRDFALQTPSLQSAAAYYTRTANLTTPDGPQKVELGAVTASFLPTLGVQAALGRNLTADEEPRGENQVIILTDGAFRRRFGGSPDLLGKRVTVDAQPFTVIGVLPRGLSFPPLPDIEGLVPLGLGQVELASRGNHFLSGVARLRQGATVEQASRDVAQVAKRLAADHPATNTGASAYAVGLLADSVRDVKEPLAILLAAVAALLLVSCTNVGGMLLARSASRERELAIRAALGGSQWRIARQLLVESSLVGLVGGTLGILAALWGVEILIALAPAGTPRLSEVDVDARIAALTFAVSLLVGLLAGVAPAIQTSRPDLAEAMREGGQHASASRRTARVRSLLVVIEVALSLCLVVAAGLLTRSLSRILAAPLGFDPEHVLSIELSFPGRRFNGLEGFSSINSRLVENVSRIPGVDSAATTNAVPLTNTGWDFGFLVEGRPPPQPGTEPDTRVNWVSPGFFHTLRIPLIEGRELATTDTYQSLKVMVVNQAFAHRFFKGERAVGQRIRMLYSFEDEGQFTWEIVGVTGDVRGTGLEKDAPPEVYVSQTQQGFRAMNLLVRTHADPASISRAVRAQVAALDPSQAIGKVQSMEEIVARSVGSRRFQALLCSAFGALALLLSALGLYALIAWSVTQRKQEIGIRMALGAEKGTVLRMVVLQGVRLAAAGVAVGLGGALAATRMLQSQLYGVSRFDPATYAGVAALIAVVAAVASLLPARRAAAIDPLVAMKSE
ncbi:MAG TPA: ABC transporter permease [Myxococcales bacterium]|nr:ABC transporter permease [Myxococcales bacterium]